VTNPFTEMTKGFTRGIWILQYYFCYHLHVRYLQLYTWNKPCTLRYTALQLFCIYSSCYM